MKPMLDPKRDLNSVVCQPFSNKSLSFQFQFCDSDPYTRTRIE